MLLDSFLVSKTQPAEATQKGTGSGKSANTVYYDPIRVLLDY